MPSSAARLLWQVFYPATLDWDFLVDGSGSGAGSEAAESVVSAALLVSTAGFGFLLAGLVQGGVLIPFLVRKWRLFQTLPVLNCVWYVLIRTLMFDDVDAGLLSQFSVALPLAAFSGLLSAAFLAPFEALASGGPGRGPAARLRQDGDSTVGITAIAPEPLDVREAWWAAFYRGFTAPWEGFGYLCRYPRLWWYGVVPVVLNLLITAAALLLLLSAAVWFTYHLQPLFPAGWLWSVVKFFCGLGLLVLAAGLTLVMYVFLQGSLIGYYLAKLARQVELHLGLPPEQITEVSWRYEVLDACRDVLSLIAINGGFLLLHIIPGIGSVLGIIGSLYYDALLFGEDYLDYPLALRGRRRHEKQEFLKRNRAYSLGLGAAVFLASFIPIIGAVLLAAAVVGAVLLHRRLQAVH
ncbi:MAG: hypothetical protein RLZZ436_3272 [Planctomycetota bacterium]|jgi:CysZ protein